MNLLKQAVLALIVVVATVAVWAIYVPSAGPVLERLGVYSVLGVDPPAEVATESGRRFGGGETRVVVAPVIVAQANARVVSIGDGRAARSVSVRSEANGLIVELPIEPGSYVEAGTLLARLDDEAQRIALERARLSLADAAGDLDRFRQLTGSGAVSAVQVREVELVYRTAELETEQAEFELSQRRILAPISGLVGLLDMEQGDRIGAQDALAVITDRSSIEIDFRVPERYVADLSVGMPMEVSPLARPGEMLTGEVVALDNVVDRSSRTLRVQGRVSNDDDTLRAGQAFEVALTFPGDNLPAVDPLAIQWSGEGSFVWLVRDQTAQRIPVTIRQRNADSVLVEAELAEGDLVVTEGVQALQVGASVQIVSGSQQPDQASADAASAANTSEVNQ